MGKSNVAAIAPAFNMLLGSACCNCALPPIVLTIDTINTFAFLPKININLLLFLSSFKIYFN